MESSGWEEDRPPYRLSRLFRTPCSEIYLVWNQGERVGQVDLHYNEALRLASMTLVVETDLAQEAVQALVHLIDHELISSHLSDIEREDLAVTIYRGEELASYHLGEEDEDDFWGWMETEENEWGGDREDPPGDDD